MYKKPELLAPAGSFDALKAALHAGCDAVYLGGARFGARANAENFDHERLKEALYEAHLLDKKIYFTANTLIKENEMKDFLNEMEFLYEEGMDAVILQDFGAFAQIRKYFPDFPVHGSTQMTIHSLQGAKFLEQEGFERVVLSRELSLKEITHIKKNLTIEIETFVHGALCYCYSGQCYMSSLLGGRSGNRGTCAQPCRLPYHFEGTKGDRYLLSPKDIETLTVLPQLIESGIDSFKIEGRMKNAYYVGLMTGLYRQYLDAYFESPGDYHVIGEDLTKMQQIFNRGGFSNGYYFMQNGPKMMSTDKPKHQGVEVGKVVKTLPGSIKVQLSVNVKQGDCLEITSRQGQYSFTASENISGNGVHTITTGSKGIQVGDLVFRLTDITLQKRIEEMWLDHPPKAPLQGKFLGKVGQAATLELTGGAGSVLVQGGVVQEAKTAPVTEEQIAVQLKKTGDTPVVLEPLTIDADVKIFISLKELNQMRRQAIEAYQELLVGSRKRQVVKTEYKHLESVNPLGETKVHVLVREVEQFEAVMNFPVVDRIYFEANTFSVEQVRKMAETCANANVPLYAALPRIVRESKCGWLSEYLSELGDGVEGALVRTLDGLNYVPNGYAVALDYTMNVMNHEHVVFWESQGISQVCMSIELNKRELSGIATGNELMVYGYLPLMITAQCLKDPKTPCHGENSVEVLVDRKNAHFLTMMDCRMCTNSIYNSVPLSLLDKGEELKGLKLSSYRLEFLNESVEQVQDVMKDVVRLMRGESVQLDTRLITRGHFNRGVE